MCCARWEEGGLLLTAQPEEDRAFTALSWIAIQVKHTPSTVFGFNLLFFNTYRQYVFIFSLDNISLFLLQGEKKIPKTPSIKKKKQEAI